MFLLRHPDTLRIRNFLQLRASLPFNYDEVGWTKVGRKPDGYNHDNARVQLGTGEEAFHRTRKPMTDWRMFALDWVELCWPFKKIAPGSTVAVLALHYGFWTMNCARIVYVIDEPRRFGFACGTVDDHVERGEERFLIEWLDDDSVWFDITSFSKPNHWLAYLGYPLARGLQEKFRMDAMSAMLESISPQGYQPPALPPGVEL